MLIFFKLARRGILLSAIAIAAVLSGCEETELTAAAPESKTAQSELTLTVVDNKGQPIAGAMVTMQSDALRRVTRFTDGAGKLELSPLPNGELLVRYPGMGERRVPGSDAAGNVIALSADPQFLRKLPSSQWLELLPDGPWKKEFIVNCGTCHEIGYDRIMMGDRPRNEGEWLAAIKMMRAMDAYEVIPPDFDDEAYAGWLADNLSQSRIASLNSAAHQAAGRLAGVEITEYTLPEQDSLPHDLVVGPDGLIWITAFFYDQIWALNPDTGDTQIYPVDDSADVNAQPRALKFDNEGQLWIVNGGTQSVLRLDPESGDYLQVPVDMYAHSLDIDPEGNIWVNDYFAAQERVARVD
ncbi:MAG TPA: hypothetical protein DCG06_06300, partial [Deltaproteobacteria bacterium]|nr:hypothetical protein [Deltaproteobacteria bacterium]